AALKLGRGGVYFAHDTGSPRHSPVQNPESATRDAVPHSERQRLAAHATRRRFRTGDILIPAGDAERRLYIILDGTVEVLLGDWQQSSALRQVTTHGPGTILGEQCFLDGTAHKATVAALSDGEFLILSPKGFRSLRDRDPALAQMVLRAIEHTRST
ncbi:MAG: cyclic nucleotide-binding domain-containing protein, partial [Myxococcota bacterium]